MNDHTPEEQEDGKRIVQLERELAAANQRADVFQIQLSAWQKVFGTSQLTHAIARLEKAEADRDAALAQVKRQQDEIEILLNLDGICTKSEKRAALSATAPKEDKP